MECLVHNSAKRVMMSVQVQSLSSKNCRWCVVMSIPPATPEKVCRCTWQNTRATHDAECDHGGGWTSPPCPNQTVPCPRSCIFFLWAVVVLAQQQKQEGKEGMKASFHSDAWLTDTFIGRARCATSTWSRGVAFRSLAFQDRYKKGWLRFRNLTCIEQTHETNTSTLNTSTGFRRT